MALSNFLLTVVAVGAVVLMLKGDVRKTYPVLRRNLRQVREWLEQEQATASRAEHAKPKEMDSTTPEKPTTTKSRVNAYGIDPTLFKSYNPLCCVLKLQVLAHVMWADKVSIPRLLVIE